MEHTRVIQCKCRHSYQDTKYGSGNRAMNFAPKKSDSSHAAFRCTVCQDVHLVSESGKVIEPKSKKS